MEVKQTALEQESAATTGGVWRCSCGQEFGKMEAIGGHISRKKNKADHKNLGFGPSLKVTQARSMPARHTCSILAPYPLKAALCPLAIPAQARSPYPLRLAPKLLKKSNRKPRARSQQERRRPGLPPTSTRHPSSSSRPWYCTCGMATKAVRRKATGTKEGVWRCSCGEEFETSIALGGHCSSYRSDKAHHKSLGFGPSRKAAERAASPKAVDTDEPAELYISDKDRAAAAGKPQDKTKKPTDTENSAARTKEEPADTTGWVYRCSCGEEFETSIALGGHCSSYRSDKAHHKSLGFGPSRKAAERAASPKAVDTDEPAELYISDKDRAAAAGKPQDKTKKPTGEKRDRTTTNIDEAAIIAIAPKEFKTSSILLWQAQKVAENMWNWPKIDYRLGGSLHKMQDSACRLCYIC